MGIATGAIGGFITVAIAFPAIAYILAPALKRDEAEEWIRTTGSDSC